MTCVRCIDKTQQTMNNYTGKTLQLANAKANNSQPHSLYIYLLCMLGALYTCMFAVNLSNVNNIGLKHNNAVRIST